MKTQKTAPQRHDDGFCDFCERTGMVHVTGHDLLGRAPLEACPRCVDPRCRCDRTDPYYVFEDGEIRDCFCRPVRLRIDRIGRIYERTGIDKKFRWKRFDSFRPVSKQAGDARKAAYEIVTKFPDIGKGLYLWGNPGTGKTLLSSIILTELIIRHAIEGRFIKISRTFFSRLKATFVEGSETYGQTSQIERDLATADILVVDDFGVQRDTPWEQETLYNLVDARYEGEKFTIFTSNSNPASFLKELSEGRVLSRIREMCRIMEISGRDQREES